MEVEVRSQQSPENLFPHEPRFGAAGGNRTRGPAIASYALRSVFRNRRATASILAGLVLGVAVVSAPWVALDSSVRGVLDYYLAGLPVDAIATGLDTQAVEVADALRRVPRVERVEPDVLFPALINATQTGIPVEEFATIHLVAPSFESVASRLGFLALSLPPAGGLAVHDSWRARGLDAGDPVVFESRFPRYGTNGTYLGDDVYTVTYNVSSYFRTNDGGFGAGSMFLPLSELPALRLTLNHTGFGFGAAYEYVWLDRGALLNPFDAPKSTERLRGQLTLMQDAVTDYGFSVWYAYSSRGGNLLDMMSSLDSGTLILRLFFAAFAIPTILIAWLLGRVGFDIGAPARRREFGVLRARGLSGRGVQAVLSAESVVLAAFASVLGLAAGVVLSRLFSVAGTPSTPAFVPADIAISWGTAFLAFLFALAMSVGASRRATRWLASEDIVPALKAFHAEEATVPHRPSRDFLLAAVGAAGLLLVLAWASVKDSPLSGLTFVLGFSTFILAPFAPFFLIVAMVRYLTRGTTAPYRALARVLRRWLGELHDLVEKNLVRAPRRSSNAAAIVTLAVAFVVGISVLAASADAFRLEGVLQQTPSDIVAEAPPRDVVETGVFNSSSQAAIGAIPGVASVTVVLVAWGDDITVIFNAITYLDTVSWLRADHIGRDPVGLMGELRGGDAFAANRGFQQRTGLQVGDRVSLGTLFDVEASGRLVAVVRGLPGLYATYPGDDVYNSVVYLDISALGPRLNLSQAYQGRYLIALAPGTDAGAVRDAIAGLFPGTLFPRTLEEAKEQDARNALATTTFSYLRVQANVAIVLLGVTVGLFVFAASAERRDELATLIARGAGAKAVHRLLMAEGWIVAILGIVLGVIGGLVTVATFFALVSSLSLATVPFVVPSSLVLPLLAIILGVWLASLLGTFAIRGMDIARVLKLRGG